MFNRQLMPLTANIVESSNITQQKNSSSNTFLHSLTVALNLTIQRSYFLTKINIYFVTLLSILNITLNLILSFVFLKLNLTDLANPNQVYVYLLSIIGISILYVWCKLVHTKIWLPTIFAILLGIVEFLLL